MGRSEWYKKWQNDKSFIIENDILKEKAYVFSPFPKMNQYGFQSLQIRKLVYADVLARYLRMRDRNVLFPVGFHSLGNSSFIESKRNSNVLDDKIQKIFYKQMLELGIGINPYKLIDMRSDEFVSSLQLSFIELYERGYIGYKDTMVYFDKDNNKIYDSINTPSRDLPLISTKAFTLKIADVLDNVLEDINNLVCDENIRQELLNALMPRRIMHLSLSLSNNNTLMVEMDRPSYMGGISFIFLNPEYIDITSYVGIDEYYGVMDYLENGLNEFAYSGIYAINPLTANKIPIFISTKFNEACYLGIPAASKEAMEIANNNGFEIIPIIKNNKMINSDLLDGIDEKLADEKIFEAFIDAEIATSEISYDKKEILLSSLDGFGPLFPFLIERGVRLNPLKQFLPYNFSAQFRPQLNNNVDVLGEPMSGTMNSLYVDGMTPIISIIYDDVSQTESIFSANSANEYKAWGTIREMVIDSDEVISQLLMPIIFSNIIKKEIGASLPPLIKGVVPISKAIDIDHRDLKRANNNLVDFNRYLSSYYSDSIRFYVMGADLNTPIAIDRDKLLEIDEMVHSLEERLLAATDALNPKLDFYFYRLISEVKSKLDKDDVLGYTRVLEEFIKNVCLEESISKKQCLLFIKAISPIMPFLADEVYKKLFNSKYSIINESL